MSAERIILARTAVNDAHCHATGRHRRKLRRIWADGAVSVQRKSKVLAARRRSATLFEWQTLTAR